MDLTALFAEHINHIQDIYRRALEDLAKETAAPTVDAVLIHSGTEGVYFADDMHIPFRSAGHFNHWLPVIDRPDQMVLIQPGHKPTYFQVVPKDFWYEQDDSVEDFWAAQFDIVRLDRAAAVMDHLPSTRRIAFIGENTTFASNLGMPANLQNERHLVNYLDYYRGMKTPYEVEMIKEANQRALISHQAAYEAFLDGHSEYGVHTAYLRANDMLEHDTPYTNIIALDEKSAILHYQNKRRVSGKDAKVLLIDAGYRNRGYCSDITRTYTRQGTDPLFVELLAKMDVLQRAIIDTVQVDIPYAQLHENTHHRILDILLETDIVRGDRDSLIQQNVSKLFFPHGLGHLLGLQVHDVGGFFKDDHGALAPPPEEHKTLRLNRPMTENMVFTIEPGLYFIPVLLDPERDSELGKQLNWTLIDRLIPLGGIRIEDNIHVTKNGPINLTR